MTNETLKGFRVAILATDGFEQAELVEPRNALDAAGAKTILISPKDDRIQGMNHSDKADLIAVDKKLSEAKASDFDAVLLPGGVANADRLRMEEAARKFVKEIDKEKKPIAVICHGPWLLVSAGLVRGRHLTSYYTLQDDIRNAGGDWTDEEVVHDANWVSSRQPGDIPAFNKSMLTVFGGAAERNKGGKARAAGK